MWTTIEVISWDLLYGTSKKSSSTGKIPVLRMGNINRCGNIDWDNLVFTNDQEDIIKYSLQPNDLLFNRTNSSEWVGKTAIYKGEQEAIYAGYIVRLRTIILDADYVNFVMNSSYYRDWCNEVKTDAVNQSNINAQKLSQLYIPIPPLKEQKRIVNELSSWLTIIDNINSSKTELQIAIKQAKSKILDLAIHGKLVLQDPNDEPASELLKRINPKTEIICDNPRYGKSPSGWCFCKISSVVDIINGKSQKNVESTTGKYPIYGSGGIIGKATEYTCLAGSTIIGRKGTINHPIFVEENFWNVDTAFGMKANNQILEDKYFYFFCLSFDFSKLDKSSALPSLTKTAIGNQILPIPPFAEQHRIVAKIEELFAQLDKIESSL